METTAETKCRPIIFSAESVRGILEGRKVQTRRVVTWQNSTVLGYPAKSYWPHLRLNEAVARDDNPMLMFVTGKYEKDRDIHLSVPFAAEGEESENSDDLAWYRVRPVYEIGDHFWVKETLKASDDDLWYCADGKEIDVINAPGRPRIVEYSEGTISPIHCPRWASRITLEIADVRVERVQSISESDAIAEGMDGDFIVPSLHALGRRQRPEKHESHVNLACRSVIEQFAQQWDTLNAKRGFPFSSNPWCWVLSFRRVTP